MTTINLDSLIDCNPDIRHGRPCIAKTGITVHRIAIWYQLGHSAEEIAREYPHISLESVYAALAYYLANRQAVDTDIAADEEIARQLEAQHATKQPLAS